MNSYRDVPTTHCVALYMRIMIGIRTYNMYLLQLFHIVVAFIICARMQIIALIEPVAAVQEKRQRYRNFARLSTFLSNLSFVCLDKKIASPNDR